MAWTVSSITREVTITDPDSGDTATVIIKKLSEGDLQLRTDSMSVALVGEGASMNIALGQLRRIDLESSIVSWDIPGLPFTKAEIGNLDPAIAGQIYEAVQELNPSVFGDDSGPFEGSAVEPTTTKS
jgi:hypothetical protein